MEVSSIPLDAIDPPRVPMREDMDPQAFRELVASIKGQGLLQPLVVTPEGGRYRLVAGSRRYLACTEAGLVDVPCVVRVMSELEQLTAMLGENLHREDPPPLDAGRVYAHLVEERSLTVDEVAQLISKSPSYVATRLRALRLPDDVKAALRDGKLTLTAALELGKVLADVDREFLLHHAISGGATADLVRRWVVDVNLRRQTQPEAPAAAPAVIAGPVLPVMMAACDWHRGAVPLDQTIGLRVCGTCYTELLAVRDSLARETPAPKEG